MKYDLENIVDWDRDLVLKVLTGLKENDYFSEVNGEIEENYCKSLRSSQKIQHALREIEFYMFTIDEVKKELEDEAR